jgi:hypothetical protein
MLLQDWTRAPAQTSSRPQHPQQLLCPTCSSLRAQFFHQQVAPAEPCRRVYFPVTLPVPRKVSLLLRPVSPQPYTGPEHVSAFVLVSLCAHSLQQVGVVLHRCGPVPRQVAQARAPARLRAKARSAHSRLCATRQLRHAASSQLALCTPRLAAVPARPQAARATASPCPGFGRTGVHASQGPAR